MELLTSNNIAALALVVSLATLLLSIRANTRAKSAEGMAFRTNAFDSLILWQSRVRKVEWESFIVEKEIEKFLKTNPTHKELLMWQEKVEGWRKLPNKTLTHIKELREKAESHNNISSLHELVILSNQGQVFAEDALVELSYVREALGNFDADNPLYYM